jgi:hypothetical protein
MNRKVAILFVRATFSKILLANLPRVSHDGADQRLMDAWGGVLRHADCWEDCAA